ncbi:MAG: hypothetical protein KH828_13985 [Clostridiales bacterium]|nr:hypothetical protein [Clostridiales bacterium]
MNYLVMECHPGYAVVLDQEGRFLKVANMGYEVGQTVSHVIESQEPKHSVFPSRRTIGILASAACLCFALLTAWQLLLFPFGTVQMKINPDVLMSVNRLNYVTDLEGLNEDGKTLIEGVTTFGKKVDKLSDELADRAVEMGYLTEGGQITLTVNGKSTTWKTSTEELLILELDLHLKHTISVGLSSDEPDESEKQPEKKADSADEIVIPVIPDSISQEDTEESDSKNNSSGGSKPNTGITEDDDDEFDDSTDVDSDHDGDDRSDNDSDDDDNRSDDDSDDDDNRSDDDSNDDGDNHSDDAPDDDFDDDSDDSPNTSKSYSNDSSDDSSDDDSPSSYVPDDDDDDSEENEESGEEDD